MYVTSRPDPRLDWLLDGLEAQARPGDGVQLILVDSRIDERCRGDVPDDGFRCTSVVVDYEQVPPKPNVWQGPQRVTDQDWWALSSARNTGLVLADTDYVVFLDDRCKIGPRWLDAVRAGHRSRDSVLAGSYEKVEGDKVTRDHRLELHPGGLRGCGGGWLFGCCVALPTEWALEVNGYEEGCDGLSGEDYVFGLMLGNRGRRVDFVADLLVIQDRSPGTGHGCARTDKGTSPDDKSHAALRRFGSRTRTELTPDLRALRATDDWWRGRRFPDVDRTVEHLDWFDGQPIREMTPPP